MSKNYELPEKFLSPYDSIQTEDRIYDMWEQSGLFNPDECIKQGFTSKDADYFSIVLPPPNVTGILHTGHSLMLTIEDIFVRYARMHGKRALWIPGTDHAAIATQSKVEKELSKKKIRRSEIGREEFLKHVDRFAQESHDTIVSQVRKMGASVDWSREAFTLDDERRLAVNTAFKQLYDLGLIYKADRIVNWDPKGQTTISDDEVVREEKAAKFYYFQYGPFEIGTARPETKFADKYIVVHPNDDRYAQYEHMQEFEVEWINGPIKATLLKDEIADMEFGTGAMTITPWHSQVDFELAEKYDLPKEQIIDKYGRLLPIAEDFAGMKIADARQKIVEKLREKGLVTKVEENHVVQQAMAERSKGIIEPQIMEQWWISVDKEFSLPHSEIDGIKSGQTVTLKQLMQHVVRDEQIKILPERFEKTYFHWIDNLRPWNISRQIWYGHRVPVWYDKEKNVHLPSSKNIFFVRHGQSTGNKKKEYAGQAPGFPLTRKGRKDAKHAAENISQVDHNIRTIICSDLERAVETAEIIKKKLKLDADIVQMKEFREIDAGSATGTAVDPGISVLQKGIENSGETVEQMHDRAEAAIKILDTIEADGDILVVGHNSFTSVMYAYWNDLEPTEYLAHRNVWKMENGEVRRRVIMTNPEGPELVQDEDTLDTWFSSGLWTFSTLGWPNDTEDLKNYHPTSMIETGADIIFFWIARMILMSTVLRGQIPFETVYFHGLVRDEKGRKISKSLGNNINPVELTDKYGADSLRMAQIVAVGPGQDNNLGENKVKAYRKFSNKLWNISRFILSNLDGFDVDSFDTATVIDDHKKYLEELDQVVEKTTKNVDEYRLHLASEELYHYVWHTLADNVLEACKEALTGENTAPEEHQSAQYTLYTLLRTSLQLLHPFMPFITEEIWQSIPQPKDAHGTMLMVTPWPVSNRQR